jgi:hypothetical protein
MVLSNTGRIYVEKNAKGKSLFDVDQGHPPSETPSGVEEQPKHGRDLASKKPLNVLRVYFLNVFFSEIRNRIGVFDLGQALRRQGNRTMGVSETSRRLVPEISSARRV